MNLTTSSIVLSTMVEWSIFVGSDHSVIVFPRLHKNLMASSTFSKYPPASKSGLQSKKAV